MSPLPAAHADDCPDVEVTFARGTDEPAGLGRVGQALVDSLRQQTGMNIGAYAVNYKASLFQLHTDDGSEDVVSHVKSMAAKCPNTPLVLGGYSQGASVIDIVTGVSVDGLLRGTALPATYADNVAAVVTFGNVADRTNKPISTSSALFGSKALDLCNPADPICHAGPGNEWKGHTEGYVPDYTDQAASFVASKLPEAHGSTYPSAPSPYGPAPYGPSLAGPSPYGPSLADPSLYGPSPYGPASPSPYAGPATSGPSPYDPSLAGPSPTPALPAEAPILYH